MKQLNTFFALFLIIFGLALMSGCTSKVPLSNSTTAPITSETSMNAVALPSPEIVKALDEFKTAYNNQDVDSLTGLLDLSLKTEIKNYAIIKNAFMYDSIISLKIISEENTSALGKYVTVSINNDAKPTTFTFIKRNDVWYIYDFRSGLSLMDSILVKAPFQVLDLPKPSYDGIFVIHLRNSGTKMRQIHVLDGTGNCKDITQQSDNSAVVNIGDDFDLTIHCYPKLQGQNFIGAFTLGYLDVVSNISRESNVSMYFYDR